MNFTSAPAIPILPTGRRNLRCLSPGIDSDYDISRPALIAVNSGRIYLYFDYVDDYTTATQYITNIYSSYSLDDGATWSAVNQITNYTSPGSGAIYPSVSEKTTLDIKLAFAEVANVMFVRKTDVGFCDNGPPGLHRGNAF